MEEHGQTVRGLGNDLRTYSGQSLAASSEFHVFFPNPAPTLAAVCQILPKGVVAVLGPSSSPASSSIISNICGEKEVSVWLVQPVGWIFECREGPRRPCY